MRNGLKIGLISVVGLLTLSFAGLGYYRFFGPKYEGARREVFKATKSYNEAKIQDLAKYRLEYLRAEDEFEKEAIASTIRHMFADYDKHKLPDELEEFLTRINK